MATGRPIINDAKLLGMDGEYHVEKLLTRIEEEAKNQPVGAMRIISDYITSLGKQAASQKRSFELEAEARPERESQLEAMGVEVESLGRAFDEGAISGIIQGYRVLTAKLEK